MSIHGADVLKKNDGRDEVIESLLEGKVPEGYVEIEPGEAVDPEAVQ